MGLLPQLRKSSPKIDPMHMYARKYSDGTLLYYTFFSRIFLLS
jgi:hypothetical protein